jgi:hypothetical protein
VKRLLLGCSTVTAVVVAFAGCVGTTDPATNITNMSAKLNAHGHTNNGPAVWWWEYATAQNALGSDSDVEVCGNPPEADHRCGPASASSDVSLSVTVSGLTPNTTYYFRACGQDQTAGSSPTCGPTLSFKTLAGTTYALDRKWGSQGSGDGQFVAPFGIAVDFSGNVYVADNGSNRIQKFSSSGAFLAKWGTFGTGDGQFQSPAGVALDLPGNVYVADTLNDRIQKFTSSGTFLTKWGSQGLGDGQVNHPQGVAASRQSRLGVITYPVYVADTDHSRVQRFNSDGSFFSKWGAFGTADGQFDDPVGIGAYAGGGSVYVADTYNDRIQAFNIAGTFQAKWGAEGSGDGQFSNPRGVAVDRLGNVYVADTGNSRIQKFGPTGAFTTKWGTLGTGDGQFNSPWGVAVDQLGYVYVTDIGNHRIEKFKPVQ